MSHPLVVHCLKNKYDVYCGRWNPKIPIQSKWHNPFKNGSREDNIKAFIKYLESRPDLLEDLHELKGKKLGCWCAPKDCHCDILAELANGI